MEKINNSKKKSFVIRELNVGGSSIMGGDIDINGENLSSTDSVNTVIIDVPNSDFQNGEESQISKYIFERYSKVNFLVYKPNREAKIIKGIGEGYFDLLSNAGIDTLIKLSQINPKPLFDELKKINFEKKLVRRLPTINQLFAWKNLATDLIMPQESWEIT